MAPIDVTDEQSLGAQLCLRQTRLRSLSADPPALEPGRYATTLSWDVDIGSSCRGALQVLLDGDPVPPRGSRRVDQYDRRTYTLKGRARSTERVLGRIEVPYDLTSCQTFAIAESVVRQVLQARMRDEVAAREEFSLRSDPEVEVVNGGISLSVKLTREIPAFADLKVDVEAVIAINVVEATAHAQFLRFSVDTDFPWWVTTLTAGVSKIVEEAADEFAARRLRRAARSAITSLFEALARQIPALTLHSVSASNEELRITMCLVVVENAGEGPQGAVAGHVTEAHR